MVWVRLVVRWLAMPLVPFLILFSFTMLLLDGQMEDLFSTIATEAIDHESERAILAQDIVDNVAFLTEPGIDEADRRSAAAALVETDGFAAAFIESQRNVGAALDNQQDAPVRIDLSDAIEEADLSPDVRDALRRFPVVVEAGFSPPSVSFGRMGTLAGLLAIALSAIAIIAGRARRTALHWLSLLALFSPLYLYVLHRFATTDDKAVAAIGGWLQGRYSTGLFLMTAVGVLCFVLARWDKRQELKQLDPALLDHVSMASAASAQADTVSSSASISESRT